MYSPINHHCDNETASPTLSTIQQKRKGMPNQQQFDKYSS